MGSLHCQRKTTSLIEAAEKVKRESHIKLICFLSQTRLVMAQTYILSTRSVSNKSCPLINKTGCVTLPFHSTKIRTSGSNWDSYGCFYIWIVAKILPVFVTAALPVIPQG